MATRNLDCRINTCLSSSTHPFHRPGDGHHANQSELNACLQANAGKQVSATAFYCIHFLMDMSGFSLYLYSNPYVIFVVFPSSCADRILAAEDGRWAFLRTLRESILSRQRGLCEVPKYASR